MMKAGQPGAEVRVDEHFMLIIASLCNDLRLCCRREMKYIIVFCTREAPHMQQTRTHSAKMVSQQTRDAR